MTDDQKAFSSRVLITKIGLDGHDRGSRIVAAYLRDAGMQVIYTPPWQSIDAVVGIARQEDIEVIGLSSLATDHLVVPELMAALNQEGLASVRVVVGGIVPQNEAQGLLEAGVSHVFGSGATRQEIVDTVTQLARSARAAKQQRWENA